MTDSEKLDEILARVKTLIKDQEEIRADVREIEAKIKTLHLKYWKIHGRFTSPIARWSETGLGGSYKS